MSEAAREPAGKLVAVNGAARRLGVRPGQTVVEAAALASRIVVREVPEEQVRSALEGVAEVAMGFGQPVAWEAPDTVWVDITRSIGLFEPGAKDGSRSGGSDGWRSDGEQALAEALVAQVRALGYRTRLAVSSGPCLARAFARWGEMSLEGICLVPPEQTVSWLGRLPLLALPLPAETAAWFAKLGVLSVEQLRALPSQSASARLGKEARRILQLCRGRDETPLVAYEPPPVLVEEIQWEEAVSGLEALLFALRGLVARLSARLEGRGEATLELWLDLDYDPAIARLQGLPLLPPRQSSKSQRFSQGILRAASGSATAFQGAPGIQLTFELASPLWREMDIERVLRARLERLQLSAPSVALRLTAPTLTSARTRQLQLSRGQLSQQAAQWGALEGAEPEALSVLLAELAGDVGPEQVGRLRWVNRHRPESSSVLEPFRALESYRTGRGARRSKEASAVPSHLVPARGSIDDVTRLLSRPVPFSAPLRVGELVGIGEHVYSIQRVRFVQRLEEVEWWTTEPASRDYLRVWLQSPRSAFEALVYVDRLSGQRYLQAVLD